MIAAGLQLRKIGFVLFVIRFFQDPIKKVTSLNGWAVIVSSVVVGLTLSASRNLEYRR